MHCPSRWLLPLIKEVLCLYISSMFPLIKEVLCLYISFQKKFQGTQCTIENFTRWKENFDAEMEALKDKKEQKKIVNKKLTGK